MLISRFGNLDLSKLITEPKSLRLFENYGDRKPWESLNSQSRSWWIQQAEKYLSYDWPALSMDKAALLMREGNSFVFWQAFAERRTKLGIFWLAECIEGSGRFIDQVMNGVIAICEETSWMQPHMVDGRYDLPCPEDCLVDLSSSETAALLAWIYYTLREPLDEISAKICRRIEQEVLRRVIKPYTGYDEYWWMGFTNDRINNWNPWCNLNVITCYLLIDFGFEERSKGLYRAMESLDRYIETYSPDGCCDEGPCYWGAAGSSFFLCLELLYEASDGVIDIFDEGIVRDIGSYIYKVHIADDYYVNYADGDAIIKINADVYNYGNRVKDKNLTLLGATVERMEPMTDETWSWFSPYRYLYDLFTETERKSLHAKPPYVRDAWFYNTQVMVARERDGSVEGLFLSAKGGTNLESHNHNDIGNFIVFIDGKPLIIDLGTEEYCAQTFSKDRFGLWYLQSQYHNCPTISGVMQHDGGAFRAVDVAYECDDSKAEMRMDISRAYTTDANVTKWVRRTALVRGENSYVEISDSYTLSKPSDKTSFNFIFACKPVMENNTIRAAYDKDKSVVMEFDDVNLLCSVECIRLKDSRLRRNWGETIYRVVLTEKESVDSGSHRVRISKC